MAPTPTFVSSLQLARARAAGRGPAERFQGPAAVAKLRPSVGPVTPTFEHQIVRLDVSGRLRLGRLGTALDWDADARLEVVVAIGKVTVEPSDDGKFRIDDGGRLRLPVTARQLLGTVMLASAAAGRLVLVPAAALDALVGEMSS